MRILKFFAAFFFSALIIFGFVFGMNWKSFTTFMDNRDAMAEGSEWVEKTYSLRGLSEFIEENPQNVSVASVVIGSPDSTILFQPHTPRVMGTSTNFLLLAAYASQIDSGIQPGDEPISWNDVSRYQLDEVDASVHKNAYRTAERRGWIQNGTISTIDALKLLAEYNDLALADYLWWNIDQDFWDHFAERLGLIETQMPLPFSGLYQAISTGLQEKSANEILTEWQHAPENEWRSHVMHLSDEYASNSFTRQKVTDYLKKNRLGNTFIEERDLMILFPKTTAFEIVTLFERIWAGKHLSATATENLKNWMRWPLEQQREIRQDFSDYGAVFDNRLGILNGIDFGTSTYTGDTTIQAVFFDRLPIAFWFHMSSNHMHQDFQQRLIFDPAMIERMKRVSQRHSETTVSYN